MRKKRKKDFILETIQKEILGILTEHWGEDVILDYIGFETCKEYFKIELEQE